MLDTGIDSSHPALSPQFWVNLLEVLPLRIGPGPALSVSAAVNALNYVATMRGRGVNTVGSNNSCGGTQTYEPPADAVSANRSAGVLFTAAAGNDGNSLSHYPAAYDYSSVISVAASEQTDTLACFSHESDATVDLATPGRRILSTVPTTGATSNRCRK